MDRTITPKLCALVRISPPQFCFKWCNKPTGGRGEIRSPLMQDSQGVVDPEMMSVETSVKSHVSSAFTVSLYLLSGTCSLIQSPLIWFSAAFNHVLWSSVVFPNHWNTLFGSFYFHKNWAEATRSSSWLVGGCWSLPFVCLCFTLWAQITVSRCNRITRAASFQCSEAQ